MLGTEERLNKYLLNKQTNWTLKKRKQTVTFTGESLFPFFMNKYQMVTFWIYSYMNLCWNNIK